MGADRYPIGLSSYHDGTSTSPRGKMQTVTSAFVAAQVRSAAVEFDRDVLGNNGEHLTPNEGVREYPRQVELFDLHNRFPGVWALAATPGYSTHDPKIGTAVDFGITRADGTNRALTAAEWPRLYAILAKRGWVHTGAGFRNYEAWHCNGGYAYSLPPITGAPLMGESTPEAAKPAAPPKKTRKDEDAMRFTVEYTKPNKQGRKVTCWIGTESIILPTTLRVGQKAYTLEGQIALLRRWEKASEDNTVTLSTNERQAVQKTLRSMK
jgi:hypothetical protein